MSEVSAMWTTLQLLAQVPGPRGDADKVRRWLDAAVGRISAASRLTPQMPLQPTARRSRRSPHGTASSADYQWLPQQSTGSRGPRVTDRQYMLELQSRALEEHLQAQRARIQRREAAERERQKQLSLQNTPSLLQQLTRNSSRRGRPVNRHTASRRRLQARRRRVAFRAIEDFWLDRDPLTMIAISAPWPPPPQHQQLCLLPAAAAAEDDQGAAAPADIQRLMEAQTLEELYALAEEILSKKKERILNQRPGKHSF